ncbi:ferredoxin [Limimaricola litoreus]|uniref:Ferredoxin n=1 Tax=Limimaricola litoreus TaxID=2955316 RepID=A0A9X2FS10_9RHOB|nr:ferredoxin [Limimaricola litoreus]MCP1169565.1 ferredoxin family protein [Limimaricola litoreus]
MAYVIAEPCIDIKDGACTLACPADCIYEGGRMFYIHPEECINCGLCLSICPVDAIHYDEELPEEARPFAAINREFFGAEVSGLGDPGGWDKSVSVKADHPLVAARPKSERQIA